MPDRPVPEGDLDTILESVRSFIPEMRGQRIFITGGTGFFGTWLLSSFVHFNRALALNAQATVLTRNPKAFALRSPHLANDPAITLIAGDIRTFSPPDGTFDYVLHAATDVVGSQSNETPLQRYQAISDGTARVFDFASIHGTRKLLLTSSGAAYGRQPASLSHIPEDFNGAPDVLQPGAVYGEGKRVSELLCTLFAQQTDIEFKIARCFAFAGPCLPLDANFAIGNFIRDCIAGQPINIAGDGTPLRSYLYAADLAVWLWTILFKAESLQPFNVGSEAAISIADLARLVADTLNPTVDIRVRKEAQVGVAPLQYVPSTKKAQEMLGLAESISLAESIRRTALWHGFHPPSI